VELRRANLGFGRIVIDERGVVRHGLFRTRELAWDDVEEYRLDLRSRVAAIDPYVYGTTPVGEALHTREVLAGRGVVYLVSLELRAADRRLVIDWRFRDAHLAVGDIIARLDRRVIERAASEPVATFGDLRLSSASVHWRDKTLASGQVEAIEVFHASPFQLRVMARGEAWPWLARPLREVPNVCSALAIAAELGYEVRRSSLLRDAFGQRWVDVSHLA
jgi:hypothetical protein